jgi:hypothetical protein
MDWSKQKVQYRTHKDANVNGRRQARVGVGILKMLLEYIVGEIGEIWEVEPKAGSTDGNRNFQYRTFKDSSERKKVSQSW